MIEKHGGLLLLGVAELLASLLNGLLQEPEPLVHLLFGDDKAGQHPDDTCARAGAYDEAFLLSLVIQIDHGIVGRILLLLWCEILGLEQILGLPVRD